MLNPAAIRALERALNTQYPERVWSVVAKDDTDTAPDVGAPPATGPLYDDASETAA